jgi:hypothetical protein
MGWRFRRSKSLGPLRVTVSKSGVGVSLGVKGARVGIGADGRERATLSVPGTGISYQTTGGSARRTSRGLGLVLGVVALLAIASCGALVLLGR